MTASTAALRTAGGRLVEEGDLAALDAALDARWAVASRAGGLTSSLDVAGRRVVVHAASQGLAAHWLWALPQAPPAGTPRDGRAPDLLVRLFEAAPGEDLLAGCARETAMLLRRGEMLRAGGRRAHAHADAGTLCVLDLPSRRAVVARLGPRPLPAWERAAPLRTVLHWWAESMGALLVHGGGVGLGGEGLLLVGAGGSGKSTTVLSCLAEGFEGVGDDYAWLEGEREPAVHALYASAKADPARLAAWFPAWVPHAGEVADGKRILPLAGLPGVRWVPRLAVRALVLPCVAPAGTARLEPVSPAAALLALAPSTLFQLPGGSPEHLPRLVRLARTVPAWRLHLAPEPAANVASLRRLLEEGTSRARR